MPALCCGAQASLVAVSGLQNTQAQESRHAGLVALWHVGILAPRPGIEPMSPVLEGGFLTTRQPGKSL